MGVSAGASTPEVLVQEVLRKLKDWGGQSPAEIAGREEHVFFALPRERATQIMLKVHTEGRGVCGIYPKDVASSKVEQVTAYSREHQHPLQCAMEET